jgi:hypothetical protein
VCGGRGWSAVVLDPRRWSELRRFRGLLESGAMSLSEIARETGLDRKTVRKYLAGPATPPRRSASGQVVPRKIDEFAPLVDAMLRAEILMKASVIHERLAAEYGFTGNYQRVKLYVQQARPRIAEELGITPKELAGLHRRFEFARELRPRSTRATRATSSPTWASPRSTRSTWCCRTRAIRSAASPPARTCRPSSTATGGHSRTSAGCR